jgi:hypothetical protein
MGPKDWCERVGATSFSAGEGRVGKG